MAQTRFYNWEDDILSLNGNIRDLAALPPGRYRGYDFVPTPDLNLVLGHTGSGIQFTLLNGTLSVPTGFARSRQGVTVLEDAQLTPLPVNATAGLPRIDLVVMEHVYVEITGGQQAVYRVIQGTPGSTPVAPALQNEYQTEIGRLYLPAACTALDQVGVIYTQADVPDFAGVAPTPFPSNLAFTNAANVFTEAQNLTKGLVLGTVENASYVDATLTLVLAGAESIQQITTGVVTGPIQAITKPGAAGDVLVLVNTGSALTFRLTANPLITSGIYNSYDGNTQTDLVLNPRESLVLVKNGGNDRWRVISWGRIPVPDPARLGVVNRYTAQQQEGQTTTPWAVPVGFNLQLVLSDTANAFSVSSITTTGGEYLLSHLSEKPEGTQITIHFPPTGAATGLLRIDNSVKAAVTNMLPVMIGRGAGATWYNASLTDAGTFTFRRIGNAWWLEGSGAYAQLTTLASDVQGLQTQVNSDKAVAPWVDLDYASGRFNTSGIGTATPMRYRKHNGVPRVELAGWVVRTPSGGADLLGTLPVGFRPSVYKVFPLPQIVPTGNMSLLTITTDGELLVSPGTSSGDTFSLDGITFTTAPS